MAREKQLGIGYSVTHEWVSQLKKTGVCSKCGTRPRRTHMANVDHQYRREAGDYIELCPACHWQFDLAAGLRNDPRVAREPTAASDATHCARGHEFTADETYVDPKGNRRCRKCKRARNRAYDERRRQKGVPVVVDVPALQDTQKP